MSKCGYSAITGADIALTGGAAKTVLGVRANAAFGIDLTKFEIGFDGVTASAVPALVELCYCTFASNAPGTNSTSVTPNQVYGRTVAHGVTAARNWTTEPTTLTPIREWKVSPAGGLLVIEFPLGQTIDTQEQAGTNLQALVLRVNAAANVNCRAGMWWERS